jgi:pimeloyl-ACP methyl ester carboxylesterase
MGGNLALAGSLRNPDKIRSLALLANPVGTFMLMARLKLYGRPCFIKAGGLGVP